MDANHGANIYLSMYELKAGCSLAMKKQQYMLISLFNYLLVCVRSLLVSSVVVFLGPHCCPQHAVGKILHGNVFSGKKNPLGPKFKLRRKY